jgi:hypothetical protein
MAQQESTRTQKKRRPLWRCPKCGRWFANRQQSHSCGKYSVQQFLKGKSGDEVALFRQFVKLVRECGPILLAPAKTRVGFQARMIFAAVNNLSKAGLKAHIVLARRLDSPRFTRIESISPKNQVHHFKINSTEELDDEVRSWLREAHKVGLQEHLGA